VIFVETAPFERQRETYLDDGEYRLLQIMLMINPAAGDLRDLILLLTVYRKPEVEDLTLREVSILRSLVKRIEDQNDETKAVR
jgi:hypothetical protein